MCEKCSVFEREKLALRRKLVGMLNKKFPVCECK